MMAVVPLVLLVSPSLAVKSMKEFVAYSKARPGELNYASAATTRRIATEMLMLETGIKMTLVPYNGGGAMIVASLSNEVQVAEYAKDLPDSRDAGVTKAIWGWITVLWRRRHKKLNDSGPILPAWANLL